MRISLVNIKMMAVECWLVYVWLGHSNHCRGLLPPPGKDYRLLLYSWLQIKITLAPGWEDRYIYLFCPGAFGSMERGQVP